VIKEGTIAATRAGNRPFSMVMGIEWPSWLTTREEAGPCKDEDPFLFFPPSYGRKFKQQVEEARQVCHSCPLIDLCREYALETRQEFGIWAALTPRERKRLLLLNEAA